MTELTYPEQVAILRCETISYELRTALTAIAVNAAVIEAIGGLNLKQVQSLDRICDAAGRMREQINRRSIIMTEPALPEKVVHLLGEVSHDLKSPLAAIAGYADLIEATGELNSKQANYLGRIRGTAVRMTEQIHQLLDVVWIESGMKLTLSETDLVEVAQTAIEMMEPRAKANNVSLTLEVTPTIPIITADATRLSQVAVNLMSNAIKYSKPGDTVTAHVWPDDNNVYFSVRDEGVGIAPENLDHLFELFYRVGDKSNQRIEGNGMGLYIVHSIVLAHDGDVSVDSKPDAGSTFTVRLPAHYTTL